MRTLQIDQFKFDIPECWNELTPRQLLTISALMGKTIDLAMLRVVMLMKITGLKIIRSRKRTNKFKFRYKYKTLIMSGLDMNFISQPLVTLFRKLKDGNYIPDSTLTRNLLPIIVHKREKYFGPMDGLSNITLKEFIFTEVFYNEYTAHNNRHSLDKLIAVLYLRQATSKQQRETGDFRRKFNDFEIDTNATRLAKLPTKYKRAILLYYEGCKKHLANLYPHIFNQNPEPGTQNPKPATSEEIFKTFLANVDALAEGKPHEKELIRNELLYEVFDTLNRRNETVKKQNEELEEWRAKHGKV